jgi:hypothetical protein
MLQHIRTGILPANTSIGNFHIDLIDIEQGIVKAGCHTIQIKEIERLATQLGL